MGQCGHLESRKGKSKQDWSGPGGNLAQETAAEAGGGPSEGAGAAYLLSGHFRAGARRLRTW